MSIGTKLDNSKLSQVVEITRPTLCAYLEFLEKTYIIQRLPVFSTVDIVVALRNKLYFHGNRIAGILEQPSKGVLFENAIFK